jgi:hypothetical protein
MAAIKLPKDAVVIIVPVNRMDKFKRDNPKVQEFFTYAKTKVVLDGASLLSEDAKKGLSISRGERSWLNTLPVNDIDDPEWANEKAIIANLDSLTAKYNANLTLAREVGAWYDVKQYHPVEKAPMLRKYPLVEVVSHYSLTPTIKRELVTYINAKYKASLEGN